MIKDGILYKLKNFFQRIKNIKKENLKEYLKIMFRCINQNFAISILISSVCDFLFCGSHTIKYEIILKLYIFFIFWWFIFNELWDIKIIRKLSYIVKSYIATAILYIVYYFMFNLYNLKLEAIIFLTVVFFIISLFFNIRGYIKYKAYILSCDEIVEKLKEED